MCVRPHDVNHMLQNLRVRPKQPVDRRLARGVELCVKTEQPGMSSGGDETSAGILDMYCAISCNAKRGQDCAIDFLTCHGFDGVPPDFQDFHGVNAFSIGFERRSHTFTCLPAKQTSADCGGPVRSRAPYSADLRSLRGSSYRAH